MPSYSANSTQYLGWSKKDTFLISLRKNPQYKRLFLLIGSSIWIAILNNNKIQKEMKWFIQWQWNWSIVLKYLQCNKIKKKTFRFEFYSDIFGAFWVEFSAQSGKEREMTKGFFCFQKKYQQYFFFAWNLIRLEKRRKKAACSEKSEILTKKRKSSSSDN